MDRFSLWKSMLLLTRKLNINPDKASSIPAKEVQTKISARILVSLRLGEAVKKA